MGKIIQVRNSRLPPHKPNGFPYTETMVAGTTYEIDFRQLNLDARKFFPYGAFVDNSQGTADFVLTIVDVNYVITIAAGDSWQGSYPGTETQLVRMTGEGLVSVVFVDFPLVESCPACSAATPEVDPYWDSVTLSLTCAGADGSNTFTDLSPLAQVVTPLNGAVITGDKFVRAANSNHFLSVANNAGFGFGTGDYTVEYFLSSPLPTNGVDNQIMDFRAAGGQNALIYGQASGGVVNILTVFGTTTFNAIFNVPVTRTHIAHSRAGGFLQTSINGLRIDRAANVTDWTAARPLIIGGNFAFTDAFGFSVDSIRITKGVGRYTADAFTPPTTPYPTTD
jgi:hypothetical protein